MLCIWRPNSPSTTSPQISLSGITRSLSGRIMVSWGPSWAEMLEFPDPGINRLEFPEHTTVQLIKILVSIQQQSQFRDKIKREIINVTSKYIKIFFKKYQST